MTRCPKCDLGYVPELASDRRKHLRYHDTLLFGIKSRAVRAIQVISEAGEVAVRVVKSDSPLAHRRVAEDITLLGSEDVGGSFNAYTATERKDERDCHVFIGTDGGRAVSYAILERRAHIWRCTWPEYEAGQAQRAADLKVVWSVGVMWTSRAKRRMGWARRTLAAGAEYLGVPCAALGWYTPMSPGGEALARRLCPDGILIAK